MIIFWGMEYKKKSCYYSLITNVAKGQYIS